MAALCMCGRRRGQQYSTFPLSIMLGKLWVERAIHPQLAMLHFFFTLSTHLPSYQATKLPSYRAIDLIPIPFPVPILLSLNRNPNLPTLLYLYDKELCTTGIECRVMFC